MKILKPGIKQQYYKFTCPNCHCEFVANRYELSSCGALVTLIDNTEFNVKCPDCEITNTIKGIECDEDGKQIIRTIKSLEVAINS